MKFQTKGFRKVRTRNILVAKEGSPSISGPKVHYYGFQGKQGKSSVGALVLVEAFRFWFIFGPVSVQTVNFSKNCITHSIQTTM